MGWFGKKKQVVEHAKPFDEEKLLIKQYGKEYKKYMKKVPWRIIPRVF